MVALTKKEFKQLEGQFVTAQEQVAASRGRYQEVIGPGSMAPTSEKLMRGRGLYNTIEATQKTLSDCRQQLIQAEPQTKSSAKLLERVEAATRQHDSLLGQLEFQITNNSMADVGTALSNFNRVADGNTASKMHGVDFGSRNAVEQSIKQFQYFYPENDVDAQESYQRFSNSVDSLQQVLELSDKASDAAKAGKHDKAGQYLQDMGAVFREHRGDYTPEMSGFVKYTVQGAEKLVANARIQVQSAASAVAPPLPPEIAEPAAPPLPPDRAQAVPPPLPPTPYRSRKPARLDSKIFAKLPSAPLVPPEPVAPKAPAPLVPPEPVAPKAPAPLVPPEPVAPKAPAPLITGSKQKTSGADALAQSDKQAQSREKPRRKIRKHKNHQRHESSHARKASRGYDPMLDHLKQINQKELASGNKIDGLDEALKASEAKSDSSSKQRVPHRRTEMASKANRSISRSARKKQTRAATNDGQSRRPGPGKR